MEAPPEPTNVLFRDRKLLIGVGVVSAILVLGAALWYAGVFTTIFSRVPAAGLAPVLSAQCVAGDPNRINLSWTLPAGTTVSSIERAVAGGEWDAIYLDSAYPLTSPTFSDARMIEFGYTYQYRVVVDQTTVTILLYN